MQSNRNRVAVESKAINKYEVLRRITVVKVKGTRGWGGAQPHWSHKSAPCNSMSPLIESIKCYFTPK